MSPDLAPLLTTLHEIMETTPEQLRARLAVYAGIEVKRAPARPRRNS